jgi:hypothetical protein
MQYTPAIPIVKSKEVWDDGTIVEIVVWQLTKPLPGSSHCYKYRLFFGRPGREFVRYDNERGKGDHRHLDGAECPYLFESVDKLLSDFESDLNARGVP